jgi:hypothetical protein
MRLQANFLLKDAAGLLRDRQTELKVRGVSPWLREARPIERGRASCWKEIAITNLYDLATGHERR